MELNLDLQSGLLINESCIEKLIPSVWKSSNTPMGAVHAPKPIIRAWMCILSQLRKCCYIQQMNWFPDTTQHIFQYM